MVWSLLDRLPQDQADLVMRNARRRRFAAREYIVHEADPADTLHVIIKGRVAFLAWTESGEQLTFGLAGPDEFFGELGLFSSEGVRTAAVRALEPTETLSIHRTDFDRLRRQAPFVSELLIAILVERVKSLSERLQEAIFVPAEDRVLRRLLAVSRVYGEGAGPTVVPLNQSQLATIAGTSRATVNRVLRQEQEHGSVRLGRSRVTIVDRKALARHAGA